MKENKRHIENGSHTVCGREMDKILFDFKFLNWEHLFVTVERGTSIDWCKKCFKKVGLKLMSEEKPTKGYVWLWTGYELHPSVVLDGEILMGTSRYPFSNFTVWKQYQATHSFSNNN